MYSCNLFCSSFANKVLPDLTNLSPFMGGLRFSLGWTGDWSRWTSPSLFVDAFVPSGSGGLSSVAVFSVSVSASPVLGVRRGSVVEMLATKFDSSDLRVLICPLSSTNTPCNFALSFWSICKLSSVFLR